MTIQTWLVVALSIVALGACRTEGGTPDAPETLTDGSLAEGDMCTFEDGYTTCSSGMGTTCCDGRTSTFYDGPCWPGALADSGVPVPCEDHVSAGCPCNVVGAELCPLSGWRLTCDGSVWVERFGIMCCP